MFHKFKITTYATLLLIGVFVLPYAGNVADVNAENYNCSGSKKAVRQCLKAVISERDATIAELVAKREEQIEYIKLQEQNVIRCAKLLIDKFEDDTLKMEGELCLERLKEFGVNVLVEVDEVVEESGIEIVS